jgi:molybdate transport system ATP-binding protein
VLDVSVKLARGSFALDASFESDAPIVALFGRSGSGKTTLVEAIAGLARPDVGRIVIDGRTLFDSARGVDLAPEARRVGYVFQEGLLFPHLSVRSNLAYGERLVPAAERFVDRDRVVALLGLTALMDRHPASAARSSRARASC